MLRCGFWACLLFISVSLFPPPGLGRSGQRKPALIRDTAVAEGKEDADAAKEKAYNPLMAEKSVKIGDFYLKKKNYDAAIQRYREALEYQPNRIEAFEALGRAYEKKGDTVSAATVYKDFLNKFPSSPRADDFRSRLAKIEKK
jgi:outer membrane protein assembly factor BamD (BamD/ComL family)